MTTTSRTSTGKLLILANTDQADTPYDAWLGRDPRDLYILCAAEKAASYAHLPNVIALPGYRTSAMVEKTALKMAREIRFDAIVARCEPDLVRAARLREILCIEGQSVESAVAFRDKLVMKEHLAKAGISVPTSARLTSAFDLFAFVEAHGLPVVVKPIWGSGSLDTHIVRTESELDALLAKGIPADAEVECFVEGNMFHVDGVVVNGEIRAIHPSTYVNGCLSLTRGEYLGSHLLSTTDPLRDRLIAFTRAVLGGMPTPRHTTFHAEMFLTPDDRLVMCEIASRTGGCRVNATIARACGVDLDRAWFEAQCGIATDFSRAHDARDGDAAGWIAIYPKDGTLLELPTERLPSWASAPKIDGKPGTRYHGGYKSGDFVLACVVGGDSIDTVRARFGELAAWFDARTRWQLA